MSKGRVGRYVIVRDVDGRTHLDDDRPPVLDSDRFSPESRGRLSGPGLRTFLRIADLWGLTDEERAVLGHPAIVDYRDWLEAAASRQDLLLSVDVLTRISAVLGIHKALGIIHSIDEEGVSWLRGWKRSTPFDGRTPVELVTDGSVEGLLAVRRILDAAACGNHWIVPGEVDRDFAPYTDADIVMSVRQPMSGSGSVSA